MAQGLSRSMRSSRESSHDDPLDEIREAVRADRHKIACVPVTGLELKTGRGPRFDARRTRLTR